MIRRTVSVAVAAALLSTLVSLAPASASTGKPDPTLGLLRIGGDFASASNTSNFGYVVIHAWEHHLIPQLKAANPNVKVLVYKDMSSAAKYASTNGVDNALLPAGVGYYWVEKNRPDWFLLDTEGSRIQWCNYPGNWQLDIGDPDYQATWMTNVTAELQKYGWDGVMVDDVMASPWAHFCGRKAAKYPTDAQFAAATDSFLAKVGPGIKSKGFLVLPNINDADLDQWKRWAGHTSGGVREYWMKAGVTEMTGYFGDHHWKFLMDKFEATEAAGRAFLGITYSSMQDVRAMRYARASFLLGYQGGPSAMIYHPGKDIDGWSSEWTINVGDPRGLRYQVGAGWRRDFTGGTVVVNPTTTKTVTVDLGGVYLMPDGTPVTTVTLQPTSGLILRSASSALPVPVTTPDLAPSPSPSPSPSPLGEDLSAPDAGSLLEPVPGDGSSGEETEVPADEGTDTVTEPVTQPIKLNGKHVKPKRVRLRWAGAKTSRVLIYRNGKRVARRWNAGLFVHRVRRAHAPWRTYRVCEVGTGRCSPRIKPRR